MLVHIVSTFKEIKINLNENKKKTLTNLKTQ